MLYTNPTPYSRSSQPSKKVVDEDVFMDANPAYGEVNIFVNIEDQERNC